MGGNSVNENLDRKEGMEGDRRKVTERI